MALYNKDSLYYYYYILYRRGVEQGLFKSKSKERILSEYSESRAGCPLTKYYTKRDAGELFAQFSKCEVRVNSMVYPEMPLAPEAWEALDDEDMKTFFRAAAELYAQGRARDTGRFVYIRAVK